MRQKDFDEIARMVDMVRNKEANLSSFEDGLLFILAETDSAWDKFTKLLNIRYRMLQKLLKESNFQLSRSEVFVTNPKYQKPKDKTFVQSEIHKHFIDNWGKMGVGHCFKNKEQVEQELKNLIIKKIKNETT
jgi:hypothetical protein